MKNKVKKKWITHEELHNDMMKDPEYVKEYNKLKTEFQIAQIMINIRKKNNITQEELAEKLATGQAAISRLESGNSNTSIALLQRVARAFDTKFTITIQ